MGPVPEKTPTESRSSTVTPTPVPSLWTPRGVSLGCVWVLQDKWKGDPGSVPEGEGGVVRRVSQGVW